LLGVHPSTIGRELKRNQGECGYRYKQAQEIAEKRKLNAMSLRKSIVTVNLDVIEEKLKLQWSPVQISGWLKNHQKFISHETIYKHIWKDKKGGGQLYKELRHHGKKYNKRSKGTAGRGCIPGRVDISERPIIVEEKKRLGDWELDTIVATGQSGAIVSTVERKSKLTKLVKVPYRTSENVTKALIDRLQEIKFYVLTMTADNGKEFAGHKEVSEALSAEFYFATPYHSWERGLNEHTNGLVRQYFPKNMSFQDISDDDILGVEALLNNRPRKVLNYETPDNPFKRKKHSLVDSQTIGNTEFNNNPFKRKKT